MFMLTQKSANYFYRFLKSGLLIDFFVKKIIYYILFFFFLVNNIFFSEKYLVEQTFFQLVKIVSYLSLYVDYYFNENTYTVLGVSILSLCLFLVFVLRFEFTIL